MKIDQILDVVGRSQATDWKTLAAWAGVVIVVMSTVGRGYIAPLEVAASMNRENVLGNSDAISVLRERFTEHESLPVHPVAKFQIEELGRRIDELRDTLRLVPRTDWQR